MFQRVLKGKSIYDTVCEWMMSQDADKVKRLVAFKEKLGKKVEELKAELDETQSTLDIVNSMLLEKGFKRAEMSKEPTVEEAKVLEAEPVAPELSPEQETAAEVVPLKASSGELLAILHIGRDTLHAFPAADKDFNVNTPPFVQFLVERVLVKMQERDGELARGGQLAADRIFSYNIVREGDMVREISVRNADVDRLRELRSSIRWTLEKMYEKTKTES
jgi:hypothetical protein